MNTSKILAYLCLLNLCIVGLVNAAAPSRDDFDIVNTFLHSNPKLRSCNIVNEFLGYYKLPPETSPIIIEEVSENTIKINNEDREVKTFYITGMEFEWMLKNTSNENQTELTIIGQIEANGGIQLTYPNIYGKKGEIIFQLGDIKATLYGTTTKGLFFSKGDQFFELIPSHEQCSIKVTGEEEIKVYDNKRDEKERKVSIYRKSTGTNPSSNKGN